MEQNFSSFCHLNVVQLDPYSGGGNITLKMVGKLSKKARQCKQWLNKSLLSKILLKIRSLRSGARSAIMMSDTEIFIGSLDWKTHPEGIYDVIDDFSTVYYYLDRQVELTRVNPLNLLDDQNYIHPPTLPRKNSWLNPPARPPVHPCNIKCQCVTSL